MRDLKIKDLLSHASTMSFINKTSNFAYTKAVQLKMAYYNTNL